MDPVMVMDMDTTDSCEGRKPLPTRDESHDHNTVSKLRPLSLGWVMEGYGEGLWEKEEDRGWALGRRMALGGSVLTVPDSCCAEGWIREKTVWVSTEAQVHTS